MSIPSTGLKTLAPTNPWPLSPSGDKRFHLLAETFKALGDFSRVKIVWVLSQRECFVGDIAELVAMTPSAVSHHLRTLRNMNLVKVRREHRQLFYSLDDEHIETLLKEGIKHVEDLVP